MSEAAPAYHLVPTASKTFTFDGHEFTVFVDDHGNPWMVATEVCEILDYANPWAAIAKHVDDEDKGLTIRETPGGPQQVAMINESGFYSLMLRSRKPQARRFKRVVTSEVLPSIRKTGRYEAPNAPPAAPPDPLTLVLTQMADESIAEARARGATPDVIERLTVYRGQVATGRTFGTRPVPNTAQSNAAVGDLFETAIARALDAGGTDAYIAELTACRLAFALGEQRPLPMPEYKPKALALPAPAAGVHVEFAGLAGVGHHMVGVSRAKPVLEALADGDGKTRELVLAAVTDCLNRPGVTVATLH